MRICLMGQEKKCPHQRVYALSGMILKKMQGLSPGTKKTVRDNEVSVSSRCP